MLRQSCTYSVAVPATINRDLWHFGDGSFPLTSLSTLTLNQSTNKQRDLYLILADEEILLTNVYNNTILDKLCQRKFITLI